MNILNAQEAFAALQKGKTVLCRYAGDGTLRADKDFSSLDQMPATVFASSNYEFCIQLEMLELAGITFTKPLMLEEIEDGQDVYVTNTYGQTIYISEFGKMTCGALIDSINSGFVQRDEENAKLQLQALSKALGRELIGECQVVRLGNEKPKKRASSKKAGNEVNAIPATEPEQITHVEAPEEDTSNDVEEKTLTKSSEPQSVVAETEAIETDPSKIIEKFAAQIGACTSANSVLALRHTFLANGHLEREHQQHLIKLTENKLIEIDPEQYKPNDVETSAQLKSDFMLQLTSASELAVIDEIANQIESETRLTDNHKSHLAEYVKARQKVVRIEASNVVEQSIQTKAPTQEVFDESAEYQILLNDLINRARESQTPAEANALIKYTGTWTEEQRKPLIDAINVRLVELNPPVKDASLSVRISKAEDLTELDALEIDVSACDEFIQPKLMEMVNKRRAELDPFFNPLGNAS